VSGEFSKHSAPEAGTASRWSLALTEAEIQITDHAGQIRRIATRDLSGVIIETHPQHSGPWGADLWWMLFDAQGNLTCAFPQGATGEAEVAGWLRSLPGFDHPAMAAALASEEKAIFPVWQKPPPDQAAPDQQTLTPG